MRRTPLTTWYSGARFLPIVVHWPPAFFTANSRTTGWPPSIAYRARSSAPFWPLHDTRSESWSAAAVRPDAGLYCERLQLEASAIAAVAETIGLVDSTNAVAMPAAARPANTNDCLTRISASTNCGVDPRSIKNKRDSACSAPSAVAFPSEPEPSAETRDPGRDDAGHEPERRTRLEIR